LAISPSKKFLAVCEQSTNAVCSVYNIQKFLESIRQSKSITTIDVPAKKRRILMSTEDPARKFISVDFCAQNEKNLVTVSSGAESKIIIWNWDKQRCVAAIELMPKPSQTVTQVSFSIYEPNVVVATGNDFYRYYRLDNGNLKHIP
jgi:WD40 repeat protein